MFENFEYRYDPDAAAMAGESTANSSFLGGLWGGFKDVLDDGLSIYQDYLNIENGYSTTHASGSPDQFTEQFPPQDVQTQQPTGTGTSSFSFGSWGSLTQGQLIGAAALGLGLLLVIRR